MNIIVLKRLPFKGALLGRADLQMASQLPNVDLWYVPLDFFIARLNRMPRTMEEFRPALMEFHFLVGTYNNFCVSPIFDRLPANVRGQLQPAIVSKLNLFQQQFSRYQWLLFGVEWTPARKRKQRQQ